MSYACLILGESGTGKTASLRNFNPADVLLIQPVRKPLPFRAKGWKEIRAKDDGGNIFVCNDAQKIVRAMKAAKQKIVIVDDWQYILASQFMARRNEKSYDKFTDIGGAGYDIAQAASELAENKRVYVLAHTATDDMGNIRIKTLGRMLDEKIVVEGMFTTVLRTFVDPGTGYFLLTHNNGHDTVKSPMGMFKENQIDNDLAAVDAVICDYYGLNENKSEEPQEQPKEAAAELSLEIIAKCDELKQAMNDAQDFNQLTALAAAVAALKLPKDSKEREDLMSVYNKRKEFFFDQLTEV